MIQGSSGSARQRAKKSDAAGISLEAINRQAKFSPGKGRLSHMISTLRLVATERGLTSVPVGQSVTTARNYCCPQANQTSIDSDTK